MSETINKFNVVFECSCGYKNIVSEDIEHGIQIVLTSPEHKIELKCPECGVCQKLGLEMIPHEFTAEELGIDAENIQQELITDIEYEDIQEDTKE